MMKRIGIMVGNGITIDACNSFRDKLGDFNTHNFFSWDVETPGEKGSFFLEKLPTLYKVLNQIENKYTNLNDFEKIKKMLEITDIKISDFEVNILLTELKHYLAIVFSKFQIEFNKCDISDWKWTKWFEENRSDIIFCHSFNYDLILESIMEYCNISYRRIGVVNETEGVLIFKPHGSIDFEIVEGTSNMPLITYPLKNVVTRNNLPLKTLSENEWLMPRKEVDIVLPNEYSVQLNYQWVKPGYDYLYKKGKLFTDFVIIGHSYAECDRKEVDFVLDNLNYETNIIIANPNPDKDLLKKIKSQFKNFEIWVDKSKSGSK